MICYLDLDGVIVDMFGSIPDSTIMDRAACSRYFNTTSSDWWAELNPMADGFEILELLESVFGESNICLLTGLPPLYDDNYDHHNDGKIAAGKIAWIKKHLPSYNRRFFIGGVKDVAASKGHLLVDDFEENITAFRAKEGKAILVPRPWNTNNFKPTIPYLKAALEPYNANRHQNA